MWNSTHTILIYISNRLKWHIVKEYTWQIKQSNLTNRLWLLTNNILKRNNFSFQKMPYNTVIRINYQRSRPMWCISSQLLQTVKSYKHLEDVHQHKVCLNRKDWCGRYSYKAFNHNSVCSKQMWFWITTTMLFHTCFECNLPSLMICNSPVSNYYSSQFTWTKIIVTSHLQQLNLITC